MPTVPESAGRLDNWKELLLDLFYFIFLIKLGNIYKECKLDGIGYLFAISHFLGIYMSKFELDQYLNKFSQKDLLHSLFMIIYSFGLFISILNINSTSQYNDVFNPDGVVSCPGYKYYEFGYSVGWLITRGSLLFMYTLIYVFIQPQGIYVFITKAPILVCSIILIGIDFWWPRGNIDEHQYHSYYVLAASLVEYLGFVIWQIGIAGTYIQRYVGTRAFIPVNINHQSARTSSFILSVYGSTFFEIMTGTLKPSVIYYVAVCLSFGLVLTLILTYFDVIPQKNSTHALGISRVTGLIWLISHPIYGFCIFVSGVLLQQLLEDIDNNFSNTRATLRFSLGIFIAGALVNVLIIRLTHKVFLSAGGKLMNIIRCLIIISHIIVSLSSLYQSNQSTGAVIGTHLVLSVFYLFVDAYKYRKMPIFLFSSYNSDQKQLPSSTPMPVSDNKTNDENVNITYVPVEPRENWQNILEDIQNFQPKNRKSAIPQSSSSLSLSLNNNEQDLNNNNNIPTIYLKGRSKTSSKIMLNQSSKLDKNSNGDSNIKILAPRYQSTSKLLSSSSSSLSKVNVDPKVVRVIRSRPNSGEKRVSSPTENISKIIIPRGKTSIDLRSTKYLNDNVELPQNLSIEKLTSVLGDRRDSKQHVGNFIEDENGNIRERIIIRRRKSAQNQNNMTKSQENNTKNSQSTSNEAQNDLITINTSLTPSPASTTPTPASPTIDIQNNGVDNNNNNNNKYLEKITERSESIESPRKIILENTQQQTKLNQSEKVIENEIEKDDCSVIRIASSVGLKKL